MKVQAEGYLDQVRQMLPREGKEAPASPLPSGSPFASLLQELVKAQAAGRADPGALDRETLLRLTEMLSLQMSYAALDSLGSPGEDPDESPAAPPSLFPFPSHLPALDSYGKAEDSIAGISRPSPTQNRGQSDYEAIIDKASRTYGVDRGLISSVIRAESGFDPGATSPKGAMGLMQLMPDTARGLGVRNAYDPEENIMGGTRFLKNLLDRYDGNVPLALAAYNWGPGNVERRTGSYPEETRLYVSRIMKSYRQNTI